MKQAIMMRGLPGSGKTTLALLLDAGAEGRRRICSTDSFFMTREGYKFDYEKLGEYHAKNRAAFEEACKQGIELVICDNTNTKRAHMEPYLAIAKKYEYNVSEVLVGSPKDPHHVFLCIQRNIHKVPAGKVQEMADGFEL